MKNRIRHKANFTIYLASYCGLFAIIIIHLYHLLLLLSLLILLPSSLRFSERQFVSMANAARK